MKNLFLIVLAGALVLSCSTKTTDSTEPTEEEIMAKAEAIHNKVITLDTHIDINVRNFTDSVNYSQRLENQVNLPKMEEGGLDVAWFIVYTGQDELTEEG
ncbi:MAG: membrane dipeptidase, partial [Bacteroidota bacterium]